MTSAAGKQRKWRLLDTGAIPGAESMSIDAALLFLHAAGASAPALHVYRWSPPAVSLGCNQLVHRAVDQRRCAEDGVEVVRRPTGGKAVLHLGDLTFSLIAGSGEGIPPGVKASYLAVSRVLASAFSLLGLELDAGEKTRSVASRNACFSSSTVADLTSGGRKMIGAAQRWEADTLLQQHSVLLTGRSRDTFRYILPPKGQTREQAEADFDASTCSLDEVLGQSPSREALVEALVTAIERGLGIKIEEDEPSDEERSLALELRPHHQLSPAAEVVSLPGCLVQKESATMSERRPS